MIEYLSSQRGLEILEALKSHELIEINQDELSSLQEMGMIHSKSFVDSASVIEANIELVKRQYSEIIQSHTELKHDFIRIASRIDNVTYIQEFLSYFRLGKKSELLRELFFIKQQIEIKEEQLVKIKEHLLNLISERDGYNSSLIYQNNGYHITPKGIILIREIKQRPRLKNYSFHQFKEYLEKIDTNFQNQISEVQKHIANRKFTPVFLPHLANLHQLHLIHKFDRYSINYNPYIDKILPEEKMIEAMVQESYTESFSFNPNIFSKKLSYSIKKIIFGSKKPPKELDKAVNLISSILIRWAYFNSKDGSIQISQISDHPFIVKFLDNLRLIKKAVNRIKYDDDINSPYYELNFGKYSSPYKRMAFILLALAKNPLKFNYFLPRVNHGVQGAKFFAAALTLLPWSEEETWLLLKRAETHILMAQSIQFIPELLEYSIILNFNPDLLLSLEGLKENEDEYWKCVIIPIIATIDVFSLSEEISDYVRRRPLSYITNPRPYYYYYGYYPRRFWFYSSFYRRRHHYYRRYHRQYPNIHTQPTHRTSISRSPYSHRLYGGTRGGRRPGSFGGGSRGVSRRGSRYSSLHHHSIG
ncbi:MAG: hypothetical protein K9W44_01580 [Candidatus Lokiarchaeota archaeon]|nr:hypothetical protein [Candidatus Harpocratesius repetitus]